MYVGKQNGLGALYTRHDALTLRKLYAGLFLGTGLLTQIRPRRGEDEFLFPEYLILHSTHYIELYMPCVFN